MAPGSVAAPFTRRHKRARRRSSLGSALEMHSARSRTAQDRPRGPDLPRRPHTHTSLRCPSQRCPREDPQNPHRAQLPQDGNKGTSSTNRSGLTGVTSILRKTSLGHERIPSHPAKMGPRTVRSEVRAATSPATCSRRALSAPSTTSLNSRSQTRRAIHRTARMPREGNTRHPEYGRIGRLLELRWIRCP